MSASDGDAAASSPRFNAVLSIRAIGVAAMPVGASESQASSSSSGVVGGVDEGLSCGALSQASSSSRVGGGRDTGIERDEVAPTDHDAGAAALGGGADMDAAGLEGNGLDGVDAEGTMLAGPGVLLERPGRIEGAGTPMSVLPLPLALDAGRLEGWRSTFTAFCRVSVASFGAMPISVC
ncbi:MAG TPA: hypothetical protein VIV60_00345 [Polyangiaceae bacterium]